MDSEGAFILPIRPPRQSTLVSRCRGGHVSLTQWCALNESGRQKILKSRTSRLLSRPWGFKIPISIG
jgi:hypothetical protein